MEINTMTMEEVEARLSAISSELEAENADLEALSAEVDNLEARKAEIIKAAEERQAELDAVAKKPVTEPIMEERKMEMITIESKEYRDAFYAMIKGNATEEQRAVLATPISVDGDASNDGQAIALPKALDERIWDNIHTAHPILADITTLNTGIVLEVTKHTAITAGKAKSKKDGATNSAASVADEANTFVKVPSLARTM